MYLFQAMTFSSSSVQQQLVKVRIYKSVGGICIGDLVRYVEYCDPTFSKRRHVIRTYIRLPIQGRMLKKGKGTNVLALWSKSHLTSK